jgi:hypothetical protein
MRTIFLLDNLKEDHSEDLCVDAEVRNTREDLRETGWEGVNWMHLSQDRDQWRVVVNTVMKLRVPCKSKKFLIN